MRSFDEKRRAGGVASPEHDEVETETEESGPRPVVGGRAFSGLPSDLRSGVESLSGMAMDDVQVHYNSSKPAALDAHAYTQGNQIHVAPGQEQHLPHEAWHVVQQRQGRVQPTRQMQSMTPVNDDCGLEHEADVMGAKALQAVSGRRGGAVAAASLGAASGVHQLMTKKNAKKSDPPITTLAGLNAVLKQFQKSSLTLEQIGDDLSAGDVDTAIANSALVIDGGVTPKSIISAINGSLAAKPKPGKSPQKLREDAAKACPVSDREYYGGAANQPHVHVYGQDFHLKMPERYDIMKNGQLIKANLREARAALKAEPAKAHLHAAIDKALLERKIPFDTY